MDIGIDHQTTILPMSRRSKRWLIFLGIVLVLLLGLRLGRNWICAKALREVARQVEGNGYTVDFKGVQVSLFSGNIRLSELSLRPVVEPSADDTSTWYSAQTEEVELLGADIWSLITDKRLSVRSVHVQAPVIEHSFVPRKRAPKQKPASNGPPKAQKGLQLVHVDTLHIEGARGSMRDRTKDAPNMSVESLDLMLSGIDVAMGDEGKPGLGLDAARLVMKGMQSSMAPFYTFRIDSMRVQMPHDSSMIFGVHMLTDVDPKDYYKQVEFQTELYGLNIDTVMLADFDLEAKLNDGILRAEKLYVSGAAFSVHRDKSIPLPKERKRKPLLSERIMELPVPLSLDTVVLSRSSITYHERLKRGGDYGSIAFTEITGVLTGLNNIDVAEDAEIHLAGGAAFGSSNALLDLHMPVFTGRSLVSADVRLENLPAREINRMTDDLVNVNATAGRIHSVAMHMSGDDLRASGTVDIRYQDLHLEISPAIKHAGVLSFFANKVVRTSNMPGEKNYKRGRFTVERKQEASVFNYIWIGLREGMLDVMLPPVLLDQMHKMQEEKTKKKGG